MFTIKYIKIVKRLVLMILLFQSVILVAGAYSVDPMVNILFIAIVVIFLIQSYRWD